MDKVKLPIQIDPQKSAMKRSTYVGVYPASLMKRFVGAVNASDEYISVDVKFSKDAQGLTYFQGNAKTQVELLCQRCNHEFPHSIAVEYCFSPVQGQEAEEELPEAYEPVEVNDHGEVDLLQLIEDELILSLPIVALHAEEDCGVSEDDMTFGIIEPEQERKNPFAVLKELKRD
ncbi:23S rRNA accumulation protein YceD [Glaciecola sp. MH2013]|uniref:23S rRNA accumulation protein YceD n=1 Tax=Glaciecola sp. MH2013 TaxID=2785524 RepID=UPI0018A0BDCC|nr:23S rRNA accumulation protein YceD [Glaciecola sp. MH2013]MBF7072918.1 23S rRNA accumulation protein YceD [Glaciecola sp. MH2013]